MKMEIKKSITRKIFISLILVAIATFGMESANASENITTVTTASTTTQSITPAPSSSPTPLGTSTITQSITPPSTSTTKPSGLIMRWVCKTLSTTVAVSAWVYTVVVTDGVAMVVAREIIRYVTVPAIVCDWFF
jgi:hypothetical protein